MLATCIAIIATGAALAAEADLVYPSLKQLSDGRQDVGNGALSALHQVAGELEERIQAELERAFKHVDDSYHGQTHAVIEAVGVLRAASCIPGLIERVDFTLNTDTFPAGDRRNASEFYPAATALRDVGTREVIVRILASSPKLERETALRAKAWVLAEIVGQDIAWAMVEKQCAKADEVRKTNLEWMKRILSEDVILLYPPRRPNRDRAGSSKT